MSSPMQNLTYDLVGEVLSFFPLSALEEMEASGMPLPLKSREALVERRLWMESIPPALVRAFCKKRLTDAPELAWRSEFIGGTGYIDRLRPEDLISPVMIGTDEHNRRFICVRTFCPERKESNVVAVFQRYTDDLVTWTTGSRQWPTWVQRSSYLLSGCGGSLPPWFRNTVADLMSGKPAERQMPWVEGNRCLHFLLR